MDTSAFDRLARAVGVRRSRRTIGTMLGAALTGRSLGESPVAAGKKKKKKVTLCLDGNTITVPRKKQGSYLSQGASRGACPGGNPGCPAGTRPCNGGCIAAGACCTTADCDPCLREVCANGSCQCPGIMARDSKGICSTFISCAPASRLVGLSDVCCSGVSSPATQFQKLCLPANNTCATDTDCLHGQHCVGNLCAPAYIAVVGEQCADRAFDICSVRTQCRTGRCDDNLCKTCATNSECREIPDPRGTCFCEDNVCLRRDNIFVSSCSQCPAGTEFCKPAGTFQVTCYPRCGAP